MPTRRKSENRCEQCRLFKPLCICALIPKIELQTRLLVVMHRREWNLTTNTANLACLALPNSEIRLVGNRDEVLDTSQLIPPSGTAALLFPGDDAIELNEETIHSFEKPLTLIVPDGNWRQARKIAYRIEALERIRKVKLPAGGPSAYKLRSSPHEMNLSTIEAIGRALGILEKDSVRSDLEAVLEMMVERRLWSRGQLPASQTRTGIPEAAFEAMRLAGRLGGAKGKADT
jgi:DTW domain-containing protein YfiP